MTQLTPYAQNSSCSIYEIADSASNSRAGGTGVRRFVASTEESRAICNDPFIVGIDYTDKLEIACSKVLKAFGEPSTLHLSESSTTVLHILRGGLNFGLRGALNKAYGWNTHASAFISAQRARKSDNPEDWYITENAYQKVYVSEKAAIVFGDVVATGTSLEFALKQMLEIVEEQGAQIQSVLFFTIVGIRSEEILAEIDVLCRKQFPCFTEASIVYLEGRFAVAGPESKLSVKYTGTDLLRTQSILAPEFINSQYANPAYPIERCTIYDAGSRAFWLPEYLEDVQDYWEKTLQLAEQGMTYPKLLAERFPELDGSRFAGVDLKSVCQKQLGRSES